MFFIVTYDSMMYAGKKRQAFECIEDGDVWATIKALFDELFELGFPVMMGSYLVGGE
jgi:hypothetical protein